jgi:branched-chain amino acid transport system substrate-binding protein
MIRKPRAMARLGGAVLTLGMVGALVAACGGSSGSNGSDGTAAGKPIVFGIQTSRTGAIANEGFQQLYGIQAGVAAATNGTNEVAGHPIKFVTVNDGSDAGRAPQAARQMMQQDHPNVVFGFPLSSSALATANVSQDAHIPTFYTETASDDLTGYGPYVYRTARSATQEAQGYGLVANIQKGQRFLVLAPDYAYGQSVAAAIEETGKKAGGIEAGKPLYAPLDATDFTSVVAKAASLKPDVLVVAQFPGSSGPILWSAIDNAGLADSMSITTLLPEQPALKAMGSIVQKLHFFAIAVPQIPDNAMYAKVTEAYRKLAGKDPDIYVADSANAGIIAVQALEKTGGNASGEELTKALDGLKGQGAKGDYEIRAEDHLLLQNFFEASIGGDGKVVVNKTFPIEQSDLPVTKTIKK